MAPSTAPKSRTWIWLLVAAVVVIAIFMLTRSRDAVAIRTAVVDREDLTSTISTNGKVEPIQDFQAHASAPSTIKALYVKLGDHVAANQPLIRLDAADAASKVSTAESQVALGNQTLQTMKQGGTGSELANNKGEIAAAELQNQAAASNLNTLEALQAKGSASAAEVAQAREKLKETAAHLAAVQSASTSRYSSGDIKAQQAVNNANSAALAAADAAYSSVDIRSPFAGTVYSVNVKQSQYVGGPSDSMLEVANLSRLQVRAYFDEPEVGKLAVGQSVKIVWEARPDKVWRGHVTQPPTTITTYNQTRNVGECLISIDDSDGILPPNATVTVTVTTARHDNVLSLPRDALRTIENETYVFRVVDNKLVKTDVKVGATELTRMEILSGLKAGDKVALGVPVGATPDITLVDGMKVKPQQ